MTEAIRNEQYWKDLIADPSATIRYMPPSEGIPLPTSCDRSRVREARFRYLLACGFTEPASPEEDGRAARDREVFNPILSMPSGEYAAVVGGATLEASLLAVDSMTAFVVAVSGVDVATYAAVTYEDTAAQMNALVGCPYRECLRVIESEYAATLAVLSHVFGRHVGPVPLLH
jgi:hypothetical protein